MNYHPPTCIHGATVGDCNDCAMEYAISHGLPNPSLRFHSGSMHNGSIYAESYYLHGKEPGKSLYENYRWMPRLTMAMVDAMIGHLGMERGCRVLDFGCARGYVVKALRWFGFEAFGVDISEWAIRNADEEVRAYLNWSENSPPLLPEEFDWVIAKDVLEHIPQCDDAITYLMETAKVGVFAVVPLSAEDGGRYVVPDYEEDVTHVHRLTLGTWARMFVRPGWRVESVYRVEGVKDNYYRPGWEAANGFITARRLQG